MIGFKKIAVDANELLFATMAWQDGKPPIAKDMSSDDISALKEVLHAMIRRTFTLFGVSASKDEIEQASEIVWERLLTQEGSDYDSSYDPCQYLRLMAMSACGKVARRRDRQFPSEVLESRVSDNAPDNDPLECCIRAEREATVRQAVQLLPEDHAE